MDFPIKNGGSFHSRAGHYQGIKKLWRIFIWQVRATGMISCSICALWGPKRRHCWLVVEPKILNSSIGMMAFPINGTIKHVPNHQPDWNLASKCQHDIVSVVQTSQICLIWTNNVGEGLEPPISNRKKDYDGYYCLADRHHREIHNHDWSKYHQVIQHNYYLQPPGKYLYPTGWGLLIITILVCKLESWTVFYVHEWFFFTYLQGSFRHRKHMLKSRNFMQFLRKFCTFWT